MTTPTILTPEQIDDIWVERGLDDEDAYSFARAIEQAVLQSPEVVAMRWQPIETAPRDGTTILVWFKQHGAVTVRWGSPHDDGFSLWLVDDHKHGPYPLRGYRSGDDTHWMPLPAPPADAAMERKP